MMRLDGDFAKILKAAADGRLSSVKGELRWMPHSSLCVVMAAKGYPGAFEKGTAIRGLEALPADSEAKVFHAGTAPRAGGGVVSNGGRVLGVTARAETIAEAQKRAYQVVDKIDWPEGFCRRDIGWRALKAKREEAA